MMKQKYHYNRETGKTGACGAAYNCPFLSEDGHLDSMEAAQAAYEKYQEASLLVSLQKTATNKNKLAKETTNKDELIALATEGTTRVANSVVGNVHTTEEALHIIAQREDISIPVRQAAVNHHKYPMNKYTDEQMLARIKSIEGARLFSNQASKLSNEQILLVAANKKSGINLTAAISRSPRVEPKVINELIDQGRINCSNALYLASSKRVKITPEVLEKFPIKDVNANISKFRNPQLISSHLDRLYREENVPDNELGIMEIAKNPYTSPRDFKRIYEAHGHNTYIASSLYNNPALPAAAHYLVLGKSKDLQDKVFVNKLRKSGELDKLQKNTISKSRYSAVPDQVQFNPEEVKKIGMEKRMHLYPTNGVSAAYDEKTGVLTIYKD